MHKRFESDEPVATPEPVQRAKNLVEEFFGLSLEDGVFYPHDPSGAARSGDRTDSYGTRLLSPTGRELAEVSFRHKLENGWVTVRCNKGFYWEQALQTAIDNFVNNPKGGKSVLGDFRPTGEKLNASRG